MKRNSLGGGLEALLLNNKSYAEIKGKSENLDGISQVPLSKIVTNESQPRKYFDEDALVSLSNSIKEKGVLQPIFLSKELNDTYEIIAGERRYRASKMAELESIPAIIFEELTEGEKLELALIENLQRENLNSVETAVTYKNLIDHYNYSQEQLAKVIGKSRSSITNTLRILKLPEIALSAIKDGFISEGHARALVTLEDKEEVKALLDIIISDKISVRSLEKIIQATKLSGKQKSIKNNQNKTTGILSKPAKNIEKELSTIFGNKKVSLHEGKKGGFVKLKYTNIEDLSKILLLIKKGN